MKSILLKLWKSLYYVRLLLRVLRRMLRMNGLNVLLRSDSVKSWSWKSLRNSVCRFLIFGVYLMRRKCVILFEYFFGMVILMIEKMNLFRMFVLVIEIVSF